MWARLSSALKSTTSRHDQDDQSQQQQEPSQLESHAEATPNQTFGPNVDRTQNQTLGMSLDRTINESHTEVMALLLEQQHPNISHFHDSTGGASTSSAQSPQISPVLHNPPSHLQPQVGPPSSPSKRSLFKRGTKDSDLVRGSSGSLKLLPKKLRENLPFGNGVHRSSSRASLASPPVDKRPETPSGQPLRHKSQHSQEALLSFSNVIRRPSLDILRSVTNESSRPSFDTPADAKGNSIRSILRDPNTPGTGQNVRFITRDAFKVISPEESMEDNFLSPPSQIHAPDHNSFMDRLNQLGSSHTSTPVSRVSSPPSRSRPPLSAVFGPLESSPNETNKHGSGAPSHSSSSGEFISLSGPVPPPDFNANGSLDMDRELDIPAFPPGLTFDASSPLLDSAMELDLSMSNDSGESKVTSTPFKPRKGNTKRKGKDWEDSMTEVEQELEPEEEEDASLTERITVPKVLDETIFHAQDRKPVFTPPLHERSQSFSFGQTVFHSMSRGTPAAALSPVFIPSDNSRSSETRFASPESPPSSSIGRQRSRALSDSVFQSMLQASASILEKPSQTAPEADINDQSRVAPMIYTPSEPDPFNANAKTYYTPQTMIPTTPPQSLPRHTRKTSKEENLIYSLQTQLTLQTELFSQYDADLRTKDEMIELLSKKITDFEKQENQRKGALRQWKKKVQDLEKALRLLEDEVDSSRRESMERSVMDEASGEALRMLHRQIASLEREKEEWVVKEKSMKDEAEVLKALAKERSTDLTYLRETVRSAGEEKKEGDHQLQEAKGQSDMVGLVGVDETELRRLAEREQKVNEEREAFRAAEIGWEQERTELMGKLESAQIEETNMKDQLEIMKNELEAQWGHTETASDKIKELQRARKEAEERATNALREKDEVVRERDELEQRCTEIAQRAGDLDSDWNESENRKHELECEVHELWEEKEAWEKEREELEQKLSQERGHSESLTRAIHQCEDRIALLEQERQHAAQNMTRLEDNVRQRDEEIAQHLQTVRAHEGEVESLREEIDNLQREHMDAINEHSRALKEASGSGTETRRQLQDLVHQKAEADAELKSAKERNDSLKNEMARLRNHVHDLQQESADKEVRIVQLMKQHGQDKEDIQGLNIALDSKQQEVELYKRKNGVRTKSTTPPALPSTSKVLHRRESSSLFDGTPLTARPPSRTTSVISDSGSTKGERLSALGKSNRINMLGGASTTGSAIKISKREGSVGSMGPPPVRRASITSATPTPASRPSAALRVKSPTGTGGVTSQPRRVVSASLKTRPSVMSPTSSDVSEKENMRSPGSETLTVRRRSMVPAPM